MRNLDSGEREREKTLWKGDIFIPLVEKAKKCDMNKCRAALFVVRVTQDAV